MMISLQNCARARSAGPAVLSIATLILTPPMQSRAESTRVGQGDSRAGYESSEYVSDSRRLIDSAEAPARGGADYELGLPRLDPDPTLAVALGRKLFFDRRLSKNDTISCAMCHVPEQAFAQNEVQTSVGVEGRSVRRNAPTLLNVAHRTRLFHDGRENALETQVWSPLLNVDEMANPSVGFVLEKIGALEDYDGLFEAAFEDSATMATVGSALAAYQRSLISAGSAFDRWHFGGDGDAIDASAVRGFEIFRASACDSCHLVGAKTAQFTDDAFHDTGLGYARAMHPPPAVDKVTAAPGVVIDVAPGAVTTPTSNDLGRYEVTGDPRDRWAFKTPTLRNVAHTAPYMHDGSLTTLDAVVRHYAAGGVPHPGQDPRIRPLSLSQQDIDDLIAFLRSLSGSNLDALIGEARATQIGDAR